MFLAAVLFYCSDCFTLLRFSTHLQENSATGVCGQGHMPISLDDYSYRSSYSTV